jgi:nucleotide-binding universal stress UspA family protein
MKMALNRNTRGRTLGWGVVTAGLAERAVAAAVDRLTAMGVQAERLVAAEGRPDEAIVKAAESGGAGLIVVGSHGRTGLTKILLGSVAERVIGHAVCPVLVVKP